MYGLRIRDMKRLATIAVLAGCTPTDTRAPADSAKPQASPPAAAATSPGSSKTLLFLGTSLTAGLGLDPDDAYPSLVQRKIDSAGIKYRVVNGGVSGETSSGLLRRLDWLLQQQVDVIVIETGANDGLRGVPVDAMRSNLQRIIDRVRAEKPKATIV